MSKSQTSVAIIGLGCRFPGAKSPDEFWQMLKQGKDAITLPSPERQALFPADTDETVGGFLSDIDQFDPQFFGITPEEANSLDPQQRLLLEIAWEALEDAGQVPAHLAGSRTGVFTAIVDSRYDQITKSFAKANDDSYGATSVNPCIAANRLSYQLNLQGPSVAINTACSSSLVAIHQAVQSIRCGESTMAIVCGINLILSDTTTKRLKGTGFLSTSDRCRIFDTNADGYVRGEGAGVVILKPLEVAVEDSDRIYATIQGSALNHNGRGNGLTGPNPKAQKDLIQRAYQQADIAPNRVQYVEAHGSSTPLGDALELNTLGEVLSAARDDDNPCAVGSVKTNIGNAEVASGMAGLMKVALSLYHQQIPPHLHCQTPSDYIDWHKAKLKLPSALMDWPQRASRENGGAIASISGFGLGGTNVHMVLSGLDSANIEANTSRHSQPEILVLSAKSEQALRGLIHRYKTVLGAQEGLGLRNVCYTASRRRSRFSRRLAIVTTSFQDLQQQLEHAYKSSDPIGQTITRRAQRQTLSSETYPREGAAPTERITALQHLVQQWEKGVKIDWSKLYSSTCCQFVDLPTYAFDHQSYWLLSNATTPSPILSRPKSADVLTNAFAEPHTPLEQNLVQIWEDCLGVRPIGIDDSFFDLGGTSILAQQAFAALEHQTGLAFPLNQLFQTPTIRAIAAQLLTIESNKNATSPDSKAPNTITVTPSLIIPLRPDQKQTDSAKNQPLFLIHALGSSVLFYQPLVQHLKTHRSIYGVTSAFADAESPTFNSIEATAKYYIEQIQLIQPHGPYYLGGASFGGLLSYEIAQQLIKQNESVAQLILFDHHAPGARYVESTASRYQAYWQEFREDGLSYMKAKIVKRYQYEQGKISRFLAKHSSFQEQPKRPSSTLTQTARRHHSKLAQQYTLSHYPDNLLVVRALETPENEVVVENDLGWSRYVQGDIKVITNSGGHMSMFRPPHVFELARQIDQVL